MQTPDWLPAFRCCLLIGCCDVPQFGVFHSLTVGDLGLMTLTTVDDRDNKNSTISLGLPKNTESMSQCRKRWENWPDYCFGGGCSKKKKQSINTFSSLKLWPNCPLKGFLLIFKSIHLHFIRKTKLNNLFKGTQPRSAYLI